MSNKNELKKMEIYYDKRARLVIKSRLQVIGKEIVEWILL